MNGAMRSLQCKHNNNREQTLWQWRDILSSTCHRPLWRSTCFNTTQHCTPNTIQSATACKQEHNEFRPSVGGNCSEIGSWGRRWLSKSYNTYTAFGFFSIIVIRFVALRREYFTIVILNKIMNIIIVVVIFINIQILFSFVARGSPQKKRCIRLQHKRDLVELLPWSTAWYNLQNKLPHIHKTVLYRTGWFFGMFREVDCYFMKH